MSPSKAIFALLLLAITLPSSFACRCSGIPTLRVLFYGPSRNLVRARVTEVKGSGIRATYTFKTEVNYKGCPPPKTFFYTATGTSCDVSFVKGVSYILALAPGPIQSFNLCGVSWQPFQRNAALLFNLKCWSNQFAFFRYWAIICWQYQPSVGDLSGKERAFLSGRQVCCRGACRCVRKPPTINCLIAPCDPIFEPPCEEAEKCVDTPCAPCEAEWLTADGEAACEPRSPF